MKDFFYFNKYHKRWWKYIDKIIKNSENIHFGKYLTSLVEKWKTSGNQEVNIRDNNMLDFYQDNIDCLESNLEIF